MLLGFQPADDGLGLCLRDHMSLFLIIHPFPLYTCTHILLVLLLRKKSVTPSGPSLCDPMDCSLLGSVRGALQARCWSWLSFPSPRDLPDPGLEPGSPALQAGSLPTKPLRKILGKALTNSPTP